MGVRSGWGTDAPKHLPVVREELLETDFGKCAAKVRS